jgi:hypothetical protein
MRRDGDREKGMRGGREREELRTAEDTFPSGMN